VFGAALLIAALGAGLALPARAAGVNVEVHGVDEALRSNVLAYLSFERYKKGGGVDLNADMVERLTTGWSARCRRRCARLATTSRR